MTRADVEAGPTRCPDPAAANLMVEAIEAARRDGDSLGGVVECVCRGVPAGLGEPVFDKLEAALAGAMLSLPAAKGFEIGSGFAGTRLTGLVHNDPFRPGEGEGIRTASNRSGGVQGGISNARTSWCGWRSSPPPPSRPSSRPSPVAARPPLWRPAAGTIPACFPRAVPMVEAMALLVLADHWLRQQATDVLPPLPELP